MSLFRPRRSLDRALVAIRAHFRETGCTPSLADLGRRLGCSRQRACYLVDELEKRGTITRIKGQALTIKLVSPSPASMMSDDELLYEVRMRPGLAIDWPTLAGIAEAFRMPLSNMELPDGDGIDDLLAELDEVEIVGGAGEAEEAAADEDAGADEGELAGEDGGKSGGSPAARDIRGGVDGGPARSAA